jgi:3-hydroxymyristoyl/3-hydroxydecanoyl-(acyl carrier protein) dehydratase
MMPLPPVRRIADGAFRLLLDPGLPVWEGHFPGDPVLAGVLQVDWAIRLGEQAFGPLGRFTGLDPVKFLAPARPGDELELRLTRDPASGTLAFQFLRGAEPLSSGRVRFAPLP